ncbi:MAG: glutathione binding-like protein [Pseudomonadota bacterium]|nr:glutathione binding-like protein [Pseudomonadota bacterium]
MASVPNRRSTMSLYVDEKDLDGHSVRLVLKEKDITADIIFVDEGNKPEDLDFLNPYGGVLTLVDRDLVLYQAQIIMEYLDERYPHPPLMPVDPVSRATNRQFRYRITRDLFSLSLKAESEEAEVALDAKNQIKDNLQALTPIFEQYKYFMSDEYSLVDMCLSTILWRLGHWDIELGSSSKAIYKYADKMFQRETFVASLSDFEKEMRTII